MISEGQIVLFGFKREKLTHVIEKVIDIFRE